MSEFKLLVLNYPDHPREYYKKLAGLPGFVLLESSDRSRGRYDIVSAYPYERVKAKRSSSEIKSVFVDLQKKIKPHNSELDLPFQGGAIGYFSYDLACEIAGILPTPQTGLESMPLMEMGLYDWAIIVDHHLKKVTLFAGNTQPGTEVIIEEILALWHGIELDNYPFQLSTCFNPLISKSDYQDAFAAIHADLKRGRCYQANLTQPFTTEYTGDTYSMYDQVNCNNPVPFAAFIRGDNADILSFSPERFIQMENRELFTSPIKGTERRVADREEDNALCLKLLACPKNRAENIMIVDLMRNDFGKIAKPGSVHVDSLCEVESYEAVHHLVSHIRAVCREEYSPLQAFAACFPGGSITGTPKLESMRLIAEQEPYARGVYCGSIGYFSAHGRFDTNIAIRTITATKNTLHLAAGGAIVIDSQCEEEYQECFTKIAGILKGLYV